MQTIEREFEHWTAQQHAKNNNNEQSERRQRYREREEEDQQEHARNYKKKWHETKRIFFNKQEIKNLRQTHRKNRERIKFFSLSRYSNEEKHSFSICLGATQSLTLAVCFTKYMHWIAKNYENDARRVFNAHTILFSLTWSLSLSLRRFFLLLKYKKFSRQCTGIR